MNQRSDNSILKTFVDKWEKSFKPDLEEKWCIQGNKFEQQKGKKGWKISGQFSFYLRGWLIKNSKKALFEIHDDNKRCRLDAALWRKDFDKSCADLAIEWEWDDKKVHQKFASGDFEKVLTVPAKAGLGIIQTRSKGKDTIKEIKESYKKLRIDDRPVGVIELRRVEDNEHLKLEQYYYDLKNQREQAMKPLSYPLDICNSTSICRRR